MFERKIKLNPEDVKGFVAAAAKCDFDVDVTYNRVVIDAKSILGVISLGYGYVRDLKISNSGDDMEKLMGDLEPYIA